MEYTDDGKRLSHEEQENGAPKKRPLIEILTGDSPTPAWVHIRSAAAQIVKVFPNSSAEVLENLFLAIHSGSLKLDGPKSGEAVRRAFEEGVRAWD